MTPEMVSTYWPILVSGGMALVWFVRLESKVLYVEKEQESSKKEMISLQNTLNTLLLSVGRVEGKLDNK
jgi:hypothetical protein